MRRALAQIPASVWALGFVSLFMDLSSEMIHALLPVYLATAFGASMTSIGAIEGIAESTAAIVKIFSGALSDWLGRRKLLTAIGYGVAAATKPIFPLAQSIDWLVAARFVDRFGKGIRGAPRDAIVADLAPPALRGAAFGLRQSLDTVGAFLGPAAAIALMWASGDNFKLVFWVAVAPAIASTLLVIFAIDEPKHAQDRRKVRFPLRADEISRLSGAFWLVVGVSTLFALARFSEAFLILRARDVGLPLSLTPLVLVAMNIVYALASYPAGVLSDSWGRLGLLAAGLGSLIGADALLANASTLALAAAGVALWGLHMGFTQGLLSTLVADVAAAELLGAAFGVFNFASGVVALVASLLAGALWDRFGAGATFWAGAGFAALALLGLAIAHRLAPAIGSRGGR